MKFESFRHIWILESSFGKRCYSNISCVLSAFEIYSQEQVTLSNSEIIGLEASPFPSGDDALFIVYDASGTMDTFTSLGWNLPVNLVDLYVEYRNFTNGRHEHREKPTLSSALLSFNLDATAAMQCEAIETASKVDSKYITEIEEITLKELSQSKVESILQLLTAMRANINLPHALLRGDFMCATARMERLGIPLDVDALQLIRTHLSHVRKLLIAQVDADYDVYDCGSFNLKKFELCLQKRQIAWPRNLTTGRLLLDRATFKEQALLYPEIGPLYHLRKTLPQLATIKLAVDADGRSRTQMNPFAARTGRSQPSGSSFIFNLTKWLRFLIKPSEGNCLVEYDWCQQEFGIAAAYSGDIAMRNAYSSGDPYMTFAIQAGAAPLHATKETHGEIRNQFKACALGVLYGLGAAGLAKRIGSTLPKAHGLLRLHRKTYPTFWSWSERVVSWAAIHGKLETALGWSQHFEDVSTQVRSIRNFPMQANAAELMRITVCDMQRSGLRVCATMHDGFLIEAPFARFDETVALAKDAMEWSSAVILGGFQLRADMSLIKWPNHYDVAGAEILLDCISDLASNLSHKTECSTSEPVGVTCTTT